MNEKYYSNSFVFASHGAGAMMERCIKKPKTLPWYMYASNIYLDVALNFKKNFGFF